MQTGWAEEGAVGGAGVGEEEGAEAGAVGVGKAGRPCRG